jgi:hypothetical protein
MGKVNVLLFIFLFIVFFADSEIIVKKNGEVLRGKITSVKSKEINVEINDNDEIKILKSDISKIFYDENEYIEDKNNSDNTPVDKDEINRKQELDILQNNYKSFLKAGAGFIIPGAILTFTSLIFGTIPIVYAYNYLTTNNGEYGYKYNSPFDTPSFYIPFSYYVVIMAVGVLLDIPGIFFFIFSGLEYKKWEEKTNLSLNIGVRNKGATFAVSYKF